MKKGFTLVEMLIVITLVALLSVMVIPNISKIRDDILQKDYDSLKIRVESAAEDWAYDNLHLISMTVDPVNNKYTVCSYVTISELIGKGYLVGNEDNKTVLENPITEESMNNMRVCLRYDIENGNDNRIMQSRLMES